VTRGCDFNGNRGKILRRRQGADAIEQQKKQNCPLHPVILSNHEHDRAASRHRKETQPRAMECRGLSSEGCFGLSDDCIIKSGKA
jgi:hypothetical protein